MGKVEGLRATAQVVKDSKADVSGEKKLQMSNNLDVFVGMLASRAATLYTIATYVTNHVTTANDIGDVTDVLRS